MNRKRENRKIGKLKRVLLGAACSLLAVFALAPSPSSAAGLLIADGGFGGVLEIVDHDIKVTINNGIAVTEVAQLFRNTEDRQVEALYLFPVPKGASVSNFSMWINGKEMIGEVVEKERAREIYNSYKRRRQDPGLLEQTSYKTFEMRIFPIAPKAEQQVQITYYQELDFDHDWCNYVYPLSTVAREGIDSTVKGRFSASIEIKSAVPITAMESPSHGGDLLVVPHTGHFYEASLEKSGAALGSDLVVAFQVNRPITGIDLVPSREKGDEGYFMLTMTAGDELEEQLEGADYVFVLDVSGSMRNEAKLATSRNSIEAFVEALGSEDRFEVIAFNRQPRPLFGGLRPATEESRTQAAAFLRSQEARGGTTLGPALNTAYKYGDPDRTLNTVVLSDGMTEQGERSRLIERIRSRPVNVRVFCVGVGNEVNRPLLRQIAEDSGGMAAFISRGDDFDRQAKAFYRKLTHPAATDLEITIAGAKVYEVVPENLPNLYYGAPLRVYGRYRKSGSATITVTAAVNGRPVETVAELDFPSLEKDNPEIERMWAWRRLQDLQDEVEAGGSPGLVDEIVRLGEGYSIASEYTSFIVLENDSEYKRWNIERKNALRVGRDRAARQRLRRGLEELRAEALDAIGPSNPENGNGGTQVSLKPVNTALPLSAQRNASPASLPAARPRRSNGVDLPGLGGGAFDPVSALMAVFFSGSVWLARRRRQ